MPQGTVVRDTGVVLQALFDEGNHLVFARFGLNEIRHVLITVSKDGRHICWF